MTYPVLETHMTASTFRRAPTKSLFVRIVAASSNPNRLWSVKIVLIPNKCAWRIASWAREDKLACP